MSALFRLTIAHGPIMLRNATHAQQTGIMEAMRSLIAHPILEPYPSITEHTLDVAAILSDNISDDVRNHLSRSDLERATGDALFQFILGAPGPVDGWLVLTQTISVPLMPQLSSQPSTPLPLQSQVSPYESPQMPGSGPATPQQQQQRYFNQQQQQRQQMQQAQQAQQMRNYQQYPQHHMQQNRGPPPQLQRTLSGQATPSSLQQMQHMQQMQGYSQQRATQPSPVPSQRPTPAAGGSAVGGQSGGGGPLGKLQIGPFGVQQKEIRQYPFIQPRWEILAESSGNPNLNETAISLSLFGARKV
jgi:mediator of RNA polymerase II transcription subunit 12